MGKNRTPKVISFEELKKKGTKELLGYLNRLHKCEESYEKSDMEFNLDLEDKGNIYFKQTKKWEAAYGNVKAILKGRKHID